MADASRWVAGRLRSRRLFSRRCGGRVEGSGASGLGEIEEMHHGPHEVGPVGRGGPFAKPYRRHVEDLVGGGLHQLAKRRAVLLVEMLQARGERPLELGGEVLASSGAKGDDRRRDL